jgi:hypothetical protein
MLLTFAKRLGILAAEDNHFSIKDRCFLKEGEKMRKLVSITMFILLSTTGLCCRGQEQLRYFGFQGEIPSDLLQRIHEFQQEVGKSPTTSQTYKTRWNTLRQLYAEQTRDFRHLDYELENLGEKAKSFRRKVTRRLSRQATVEININGEKFDNNAEAAKHLDRAIMRLGMAKSAPELEKEKEKFRMEYPSQKTKYSISYNDKTYNVYWGDLHGHSVLSDGVNAPEYYYRFAKEITHLDFCSLTDHGRPLINKDEQWQRALQVADNFNKPDAFVTLPGVEWSSSGRSGHINVIYYSQLRPESAPSPHRPDYPNTAKGLFGRLDIEKNDNMFLIRNHTAAPKFAVDWDCQNQRWNRLIDIVSSIDIDPLCYYVHPHESTLQTALEKGYRFGFVGTSDTHRSWPGSRRLTAVFSQRLTRKDLGESLNKRFCYAAEDRIFVDFRINETPMGSEITVEPSTPLALSVTAEGIDSLKSIVIVKNNRSLSALNATPLDSKHITIEQTYDSQAEQTQREVDYYFVIVTQKNGKKAWSSPIWVTNKP